MIATPKLNKKMPDFEEVKGMTRDEAFQQYEETLAKIDKQAYEARENARIVLREQLNALRDASHAELKAIRVLEQKTKRGRSK